MPSNSTKCPICGHVGGGHLCKPVPTSTNNCPECEGTKERRNVFNQKQYGRPCRTCKGTGIAPEPAPNPSSERDELKETLFQLGADAILGNLNPTGDTGVDRALDRIHHHTQIAQVRYALEVLKPLSNLGNQMCEDGVSALEAIDKLCNAIDSAIQAQQSSLDKLIGEKE